MTSSLFWVNRQYFLLMETISTNISITHNSLRLFVNRSEIAQRTGTDAVLNVMGLHVTSQNSGTQTCSIY